MSVSYTHLDVYKRQYEEGVKNNYFCKDANGNDFVAAVWPGRVHMPDFLNSEARKWFGEHYACLTDKGIDGFWNDMNEPALFYSDKSLKAVFEKLHEYDGKDIDLQDLWAFQGMVNSLANNPEDYRSFYHNVDGKMVRHDKVHNLYGYNMTRSASEAFDKIAPGRRILMFSRSSYIGMHRYGGCLLYTSHYNINNHVVKTVIILTLTFSLHFFMHFDENVPFNDFLLTCFYVIMTIKSNPEVIHNVKNRIYHRFIKGDWP